jgi:hypothetical protein
VKLLLSLPPAGDSPRRSAAVEAAAQFMQGLRAGEFWIFAPEGLAWIEAGF